MLNSIDYFEEAESKLTLTAQWHIHVVNGAVCAKDLAQMLLLNVFCQALYNNLGLFWSVRPKRAAERGSDAPWYSSEDSHCESDCGLGRGWGCAVYQPCSCCGSSSSSCCDCHGIDHCDGGQAIVSPWRMSGVARRSETCSWVWSLGICHDCATGSLRATWIVEA